MIGGGPLSTIKSFFTGDEEKQPTNALQLIRKDHEKVQRLFEEFESSDATAKRLRIVQTAFGELEAHTRMEEEVFYPRLRREIGREDFGMMDEALEEHHVAKMLIGELRRMKPGDERFAAKFKVLAESVRHHIREEESKMLPRAEQTDLDFAALGEQMQKVKLSVQKRTSAGRQTSRQGRSTQARRTSKGRVSGKAGQSRAKAAAANRRRSKSAVGRQSTPGRSSRAVASGKRPSCARASAARSP